MCGDHVKRLLNKVLLTLFVGDYFYSVLWCGTYMYLVCLSKAFSRYQMQQITSEFMDTFGLDEEELKDPDDSIR